MWLRNNYNNNVVMPPEGAGGYGPSVKRPKSHVVTVALIVMAVFLFFGLGTFGFWAYGQMQDYKIANKAVYQSGRLW